MADISPHMGANTEVKPEASTQVRLLGSAHLLRGPARLDLPPTAPGALLALLANKGDWVSREHTMALFWPDVSDADAQRHLRVTLHRSKQLLQEWRLDAHLLVDRRRLRLDLPCDVPQFRQAMGRGDWAGAVALHHAPFLDGFALRGFAAVDEWMQLEREALQSAWRGAALREAVRLEANGQASAAAALLLAQLQFDLLAEDVVQALLRVAAPAGERVQALDAYERYCRRAHSELGLAPVAQTVALAKALKDAPQAPPPHAIAASSTPISAIAFTAHQPKAAPFKPPPLLAREAELAQLSQLGAGLCVVTGEPGAGKTMLVAQACAKPTSWWLHGREELQGAPLQALLNTLMAHLPEIQKASLSPAQRRDLARLLPALREREVLAPASSSTHALRSTLIDLLPGLCAGQLLIDDLQWLDSATLDLLAALALSGRMRLLATQRASEGSAELAQRLASLDAAGALTRLPLAPLSAAAMDEMLKQLSGRTAPRFAAWLHKRSGGNAFFAVETLRSLHDEGRLAANTPTGAKPSSGWASDLDALSLDYSELQVPTRVAALVAQRLAHLSDTTRRALSIAAVAGDAQHLEPLAQVAGLSGWAMADAIAQAQDLGLLTGRHFAHDLMREALYASVPEPLRELLHANVARHCTALLSPHVLAGHWWAAKNTALAVATTRQAAELDITRGLPMAGLALLAQAHARVTDPMLRADLDCDRARCAMVANQLQEAHDFSQAALQGLPGPTTRLQTLLTQGDLALLQGRISDAATAHTLAAEIDANAIEVLNLLGKVSFNQGAHTLTIEVMQGLVKRLRREPPGTRLVDVLTGLGAAFDALERYAEGLVYHREALQMARHLGARYAVVEVVVNMMYSMPSLGLVDEALALAQEAVALGDYDATPALLNNMAWWLNDLGRVAQALALYERLTLGNDPTLRAYAWAKLVHIHRAAGNQGAAQQAIQAGLASLPHTDHYGAHAAVVIAVLEHGSAADAITAKSWLRDQTLEPDMQRRLDEALARHALVGKGKGKVRPKPLTPPK